MNKPVDNREEGPMPLPTPVSPRELDEKILAHARRAAPPKRYSLPLGWAGGMTATAVLLVAVYLASLPGPDTATLPVPETIRQEAEPTRSPVMGIMGGLGNAKRESRASADYDALLRQLDGSQLAPASATNSLGDMDSEQRARTVHTIDVGDTLDQLRSLVEAGRVEQARRQYEVIRLACGECRFPDTLEQALDAQSR